MKTAAKHKPEACNNNPIKTYPNEDQRATIESHCAAEGISLSGFLIREGVRAAAAYQQIKRLAANDQGTAAGLRIASVTDIATYQAQSTRYPFGDEGGETVKPRRDKCDFVVPAGRHANSDRYMVRRDPPCVRRALPAASRGVHAVQRLRL